MNKKNACKLLAWTMTAALTLTADPSTGMMASAKNTSKVSTKWYTISKKPGTYQQKVTLKVTAKKGFQVYQRVLPFQKPQSFLSMPYAKAKR